MGSERDYLVVLQALHEIPFGVGKKLLSDFLRGDKTNASIERNKLHTLPSFGGLSYSYEEVVGIVERLKTNGCIKLSPVKGQRFLKVLQITEKGIKELKAPKIHQEDKIDVEMKLDITSDEQELIDMHSPFLEQFNLGQKCAIVSPHNHILCLAGAGSGKTTVLSKRIEFLVAQGVAPSKILAITFTRKARAEMQARINAAVTIETFNSFCEKVLRQSNTDTMIAYKDKIAILQKALRSLGITMKRAISMYFTPFQRRGKTQQKLFGIFMNDCFFIRDYCKFKKIPITKEIFLKEPTNAGRMMFEISIFIEQYMEKKKLRDFTDQLIDAVTLFKQGNVPHYEHILVDEFQDVNAPQKELIELLKPDNLFCVGDPRQSIYGWRGSDISFILDFEGKKVIPLSKNYRSSQQIVDLCNECIRPMGMIDLEASFTHNEHITINKFKTGTQELAYIAKLIQKSKYPHEDIFILARTNNKLVSCAQYLRKCGISCHVKSEDKNSGSGVTLSTVHSIKGLEAEMVIIMDCANFPCKASEHPVIDMIKVDEYDRESEERRLFYVALSRAKRSLHLTYTRSNTYFFTDAMIKQIGGVAAFSNSPTRQRKRREASTKKGDARVVSRIKRWRSTMATNLGVPAYRIFPDKTVHELALKLPKTTKDLADIHGLGAIKISQFGEDILKLIT